MEHGLQKQQLWRHRLVIVGGGPAGVSLLVRAAKERRLGWLLNATPNRAADAIAEAEGNRGCGLCRGCAPPPFLRSVLANVCWSGAKFEARQKAGLGLGARKQLWS